MALYLVRCSIPKRARFSVIVNAADSGAALTAAQAESVKVKDTWVATLLSDAVADAPVTIFGDAIFAGERLPGQ